MRVFLDTNVLVSAFATRGLCADLMRFVLAEHELLVGEVVLAELSQVLSESIGLPPESVAEIDHFLRDQEVIPWPDAHPDLGLRDEDDEWIVASAAAGEADALVTGDSDLLTARDEIPVCVYSPRDFWQLMREAEG